MLIFKHFNLLWVWALAFVIVPASRSWGEDQAKPVRIVGSGPISRPLSLAVPILNDRGLTSKVIAAPGSTISIALVGEGAADIALAIRPVSGEDRAAFPQRLFNETLIGYQALALAVPSDVWAAGVRSLTREQIRKIYEKQITNWKEVGGENRPIKFFKPDEGVGVWEFFVTWLYGDIRKAPLGNGFDTVNGGRETRDTVEFNAGSLGLISPSLVDGKGIFALAVRDENGESIEPTMRNIYDKHYPIERPLLLVTGDRPTGDIRKVIDFMCGAEGQELVKKSEFVPLEAP